MKATNHPKLFGLILAGGYSQRMGQDKALLDFHGKPQIEHLFGLLEKHCAKVFLSKRKDQKAYKDFAFVDDAPVFAGHGPLSGILSALQEQPGADWLVVACDLPFITDKTFQTLISHQDHSKTATAFISTHDQLPEPLCAIWQAAAYASILKLFNEGIHCPRKVLIKSNTRLLKQENPHWLDNINTPEELAEMKKTGYT